jgi:UPF0716 protein FxsA
VLIGDDGTMFSIVLFIAFLVVPVLEIYVIIQVGEVIGGWETVFLLLAESLLGAWIVKREGRRAWRMLRETLASGRMPDRELADAALILVGGALLLTPGFLTDVFGFLCVLPFTRPAVRRMLTAYAGRKVGAVTASGGGFAHPQRQQRPHEPGGVVQGEVLDDDK